MNRRTRTQKEDLLEENLEKEVDESELKSKTQLKNEADVLKKIGLSLVDLSRPQLNSIPLDDQLRTAIELATKINRKKDGFRRQLQLIGKMLRDRDVDPIKLSIEKLRAPHLSTNQLFHKLERLRDEIVALGDKGVQQAVEKYPQLDRQKLRQLQRQAVKQKEADKSPVASREIFQYLKLTIDE